MVYRGGLSSFLNITCAKIDTPTDSINRFGDDPEEMG